MTIRIRNAFDALPFVVLAAAVTGCASVDSTQLAASGAQPDKSFRTGSRLPIPTEYFGPELLKSIEAERDREAMDKMVNPIRPLVAP